MEPEVRISSLEASAVEEAQTWAKQPVDDQTNQRLEKIAEVVESWSAYLATEHEKRNLIDHAIKKIERNRGSVNETCLEKVRKAFSLFAAFEGQVPAFTCIFSDENNRVFSEIGFALSPSQEQVDLFQRKLGDPRTKKIDVAGLSLPKEAILASDRARPEEITTKKRFYGFFQLVYDILNISNDFSKHWFVFNEDGQPTLLPNVTRENPERSKKMSEAVKRLETELGRWSGFLSVSQEFKSRIEDLIKLLEGCLRSWAPTKQAEEAEAHFEQIKKITETFPKAPYLFVRYLDGSNALLVFRVCSKIGNNGKEIWEYASEVCDQKNKLYLPSFKYIEMGSVTHEGAFCVESNARVSRPHLETLIAAGMPSFETLSAKWEVRFGSSIPGVSHYIELSGIHMCLLAYYSEFIKHILQNSNHLENQEKQIYFEEHSYNAFEMIIRILLWDEGYSSITWENFTDVLSMANFLQLRPVRRNDQLAKCDLVREMCGRWFQLNVSKAELKHPEMVKLLQVSVNFGVESVAATLLEKLLEDQIKSSSDRSFLTTVAAAVHAPSGHTYNKIVSACLARLTDIIKREPVENVLVENVLDVLKFAFSQRSAKASDSINEAYTRFVDGCIAVLKGNKKLSDGAIENILRFANAQKQQEGLDPRTKTQVEDLHLFAKTKLNEGLPGISEERFIENLKNRFKIITEGGYEEFRKNCEQRVSEYLLVNPSKAHLFKEVPLQTLSLRDSLLDDQDVARILQQFPSLRFVDLSKCTNIRGECLKSLGEGVTSLDLSGCVNLQDPTIRHLFRLQHLATLNLSRCTLSGSGFSGFQLPALRVLSLEGCKEFDITCFENSDSALRLEELNLNDCLHFRDDDLETFLVKVSATLTKLSIRSFPISAYGISKLEKLEVLDAFGCTNINIEALPNSLLRLTLDVAARVMRKQSKLKTLNLKHLTLKMHPQTTIEDLITSFTASQETLEVLNLITAHDFEEQKITELQNRFVKAKISVVKGE